MNKKNSKEIGDMLKSSISLSNDLEKRSLTVVFPKQIKTVTLSAAQVQKVIEELTNQIREWQ